MAKQDLPSPELLRKLLRYEPDTGKIFWRKRHASMFTDGKQSADHRCAIWNGRYAGKEAFTALDNNGYNHGQIFARMFRAHRVIWALVHGEWPKDQVDHINGVRDDNRIANLREATDAENKRNQKRRSDNTSGITGVWWIKSLKKWRAEINDATGRKYLGCFAAKADAIAARRAAEADLCYHENHGRR